MIIDENQLLTKHKDYKNIVINKNLFHFKVRSHNRKLNHVLKVIRLSSIIGKCKS